jgi:hypothetical protein
MSYNHLYGKSLPYQSNNNMNPRSRFNESGNKFRQTRDSKIIADKLEKEELHYDEIARMEVLNDSEIPRRLLSMNTFRKYNIYHDLSYKNSLAGNTIDFFTYDLNGSKIISGGGKMYKSGSVLEMKIGTLKLPNYLANLGYDLSEIFVNIRNLIYSYNNGEQAYQFKMLPSPLLSFNDPIKQHYNADIDEFIFVTPQNLDVIELELRDKVSRIEIPYPINSGTITTGLVTIITSVNHGLQNGFIVAILKCSNANVSMSLRRLNAITIIDADNFSISIDTTNNSYLNGQKCEYLVDNFNFELNIKFVNINWDTNAIASSRK